MAAHNNFGTRPREAAVTAGRAGGKNSPQRGRFAYDREAARAASLKRHTAARARRSAKAPGA